MLKYSRDRNEGTYRSGEGGEGPHCDPGFELLLGGNVRVVEDNKWDGKKKIRKSSMRTHAQQYARSEYQRHLAEDDFRRDLRSHSY